MKDTLYVRTNLKAGYACGLTDTKCYAADDKGNVRNHLWNNCHAPEAGAGARCWEKVGARKGCGFSCQVCDTPFP